MLGVPASLISAIFLPFCSDRIIFGRKEAALYS